MQQRIKNSGLNRAKLPYPLMVKQKLSRQIAWISKKIAKSKAKLELLTKYKDFDIFTSLRPKIGKKFLNEGLERNKQQILKNCRSEILEISKKEVNEDMNRLIAERNNIFEGIQK